MRLNLREPKTIIKETTLNKFPGRRMVVWWYGGITKNPKASSVPMVTIFFRWLDDNDNLRNTIVQKVALTHLGLFRIGSVWQDGINIADVDYHTEIFDVSFYPDHGWKIVSPYNLVHNENRINPIPKNEYPLTYSPDQNYLLDFSLPSRRNLLIPCTEFFFRCYGHSAEVKRILATYPWEQAKERLFKPIEEPAQPNTWPVKLAMRLRNDDVVFLAHALYDHYAQQAAKSIYAQFEAVFQANNPLAFIQVTPWFTGNAQLYVAGIRINGGNTFLGLRVLGCSHPKGDTILRDRENSNKVTETANSDADKYDKKTVSFKNLRNLPHIIDLTSNDEPDHASSSIEIEDEDFKVLGEPRKVIDVRHNRKDRSATYSVKKGDETLFSTGESYGSGKGIGVALIYARASIMDSQGILRDMWNAVLHMKESQSDVIQAAEWFTFEDEFKNNPEPKLIALEPFSEDDERINVSTKNWIYYDVNSRIPRGVLVIRLTLYGKIVYLLEVQRRTYAKQNDSDVSESKESYKGLVFTLNDQQKLVEWLHTLLADLREVKGVVRRLTRKCPGVAYTFKHKPAKNETVACEAAVRNALKKLGVNLSHIKPCCENVEKRLK
ncbi:hypothetical protein [Desulfonatronum parangueonense]